MCIRDRPNAEIMIHQPSGGAKGQATEIKIVAENILKTRKKLNEILAANTGKPLEVIERDTERDNYMSAPVSYTHLVVDKYQHSIGGCKGQYGQQQSLEHLADG